MTAPVPQAAVDAAQLARGCSPIRRTVGERRGPLVCNTHGCEWSDAGCLVAIDVAAAVVAAVQGPIRDDEADRIAQHLTEGADVDEASNQPTVGVSMMRACAESIRERDYRLEAQP